MLSNERMMKFSFFKTKDKSHKIKGERRKEKVGLAYGTFFLFTFIFYLTNTFNPDWKSLAR